MKRFPNGVEGEFFHQKRVPAKHPDYVDEVPVSFPSGHSTVFAVVDNAAALAWVANLGCIELHTWHSRVPEIELPDYLLIDLDPSARRAVAVRARDRARRARGDGRARARVVPEDVRARPACTSSRRSSPSCASPRSGASRRRSPRRSSGGSATSAVATTTWRVADREGVFVDFGQNARDRTIASAYSVRPTPTRASRRRSPGTRSPASTRPRSRSRRCARGSPRSATRCAACGAQADLAARASRARPRTALTLSITGRLESS